MNWQLDDLARLVDKFRARGAVNVSIPIDVDLMDEMIAATRRDHDQAAEIEALKLEIRELEVAAENAMYEEMEREDEDDRPA